MLLWALHQSQLSAGKPDTITIRTIYVLLLHESVPGWQKHKRSFLSQCLVIQPFTSSSGV